MRFMKRKPSNEELVSEQIGRILGLMANQDPTSDEYELLKKRYQELNTSLIEAQTYRDNKSTKIGGISKDGLVNGAISAGEVGMVLFWDELKYMSKNALRFIKLLR